MADYTKTAIAEIRDFMWDSLQTDGILNKNDYIADGFPIPLVPIIPSQQVPEFNNLMSGKPYIVYDFEINDYNADYWICEETLMLSINSHNYNKIVEIITYLVDLFRRMDDAAKDMNSFKAESSPFKYHYFYINNAQSPSAAEEEGGLYTGFLDISFKYSREIMSNGRFLR